MTLDIFKEKGTALDKQLFTWRDLVQTPTSKLDDDAFTRVRIILMNGLESEALRFSHAAARMNGDLRLPLAQVRRAEQHQQTLVNWLLPADLSTLETTIGFEQVAIEVTASVAQHEPDDYLAQVYRFGLLEDFDHLYRFSALMDRMSGGDANNIIQNYSDIMPGRPTKVEHRAPEDNLRNAYDSATADPLSKIHAVTITAAENQTHDYYMTIGPMFADPIARQLYAEIASIEEQHVTQYESLTDPNESILEKWLLHEAMEVYNYYGCMAYETNPRIKQIWERFCNYELGHLHMVMDLFKKIDKRDPAEVLPQTLPEPIEYESHRQFVRETLNNEVDLRAAGAEFIDKAEEPERAPLSIAYREQMNSEGSPSEIVAAGYTWTPGTELLEEKSAFAKGASS
jgi:hypothetical protein